MRIGAVTVIVGMAAGMMGCGQGAPPPTRCAESLAQTPAQSQSQAPAQAQAQEQIHEAPPRAKHLAIKRLVIAHGVRDHEPIDAATDFTVADASRVYAFVEVENKERAPGAVVVTFEAPSGQPQHGDVRLAVGAQPRWRTWAFTRAAREPGTWAAVVRDERGQELARATFDVTL